VIAALKNARNDQLYIGEEMQKKTLQQEFKNPGSLFRGAPFWAWNGKLEPDELRRQIRLMKEMGLGGFFMHSRVGLDTPYLSDEWFNCVRACCEEAEKLGMKAWLYDEDRWPSGAAGGLVTKDLKYRARSLVMEKLADPRKLKWTKDIVAVFAGRVAGTSARGLRRILSKKPIRLSPGETLLVFSVKINECSSWFNGYAYLDTLNPEAVQRFIKVTYDAYRKKVGARFGKSVPGIFTDEPYQGNHLFSEDWEKTGRVSCPWTGKLPLEFKRRYGYELKERLPEIFLDVNGQSFTPARYHYHECVTHLFVESFSRQIGEWCGQNNLLFTGHALMEDTLSSQTEVVGNCMRLYEYMQAPGMDLLTEYWRIFTVAKQVSSVARQFNQIGADGGFLTQGVTLDQLLMGPAERADVIVDFTGMAGATVYRVNDGPDEPFGGFPVELLADKDTTAQIIKIQVGTTVSYNGADPGVLPGPLPAAALPVGGTTRQVSLNEIVSTLFDGPIAALLGTVDVNGVPTPLHWGASITETIPLDNTEVWEIFNFTEDAHPIHVHLVQFAVVNRQALDIQTDVNGVITGSSPTGPTSGPESWETQFKDTVIAYPGQITRIRAKFDRQGLFVWHCHILEHEDNEMMRPYRIE